MTRVENNKQKFQQFMNDLLCGMYFEGYKFDTSFTLRFGGSYSKNASNKKLPMVIELCLLGDWWFYTEKEWSRRLSIFKNSAKLDLEGWSLDEPLQAFELTRLRWSEGSEICSVSLESEVLEIKFKNERQLNISCMPVEGETWTLVGKNHIFDENGELFAVDELSVTCEGGEYFINTLQL